MLNKGIYLPATILSYVKPLRVSPVRNRTSLEVSMHNHWLNNIIIAVVGGWQVLKQTFLSLWFLHCMYLSFIFDALQISFYIICRINCRYFFRRARASTGRAWNTKQEGRREGEKLWRILTFHASLALTLAHLKNAKKWRQFCRLY